MRPPSLRHRLECALLSGARGALRVLPGSAAAPVGAALGRLWWMVDGRRRRTTLANLEGAGIEPDPRRRRRLAARAFTEYGANALVSVALRNMPAAQLAARLDWEGWENFEDAEAPGRGVIVLSAHLGSFEVGAWGVAGRRSPVHVVTRRLDNPVFDAELQASSRARGIERIERRSALRTLLRVLRGGGRAGFAIDQRVQPAQAIDLPFFGRRAFISFGPALLSTISGAPIVPLFAHRDGSRHRVRLGAPLRPSGEGPQAVEELTVRYLAVLEEEIRKAPERWTWQHRLWRAEDADVPATSSIAVALRGAALAEDGAEDEANAGGA